MRAFKSAANLRTGFTLLELLVVVAILFSLAAIGGPTLTAMGRSVRVNMAARRVQAALQQNASLVYKLSRPDGDTSAPRIPGAHFFGMALVFDDSAHKAWFAINQQSSLVDPTKPSGPANYLETQMDPAETQPPAPQPATCRKAYLRIKGDATEHMDLPDSLCVFGVAVDTAAGTLTLHPPPFAVCISPRGSGMPRRKYIEVDLAATDPVSGDPLYTPAAGYARGGFDNPTYPLVGGTRRVPTTLPWVLVVARSSSGASGWSTDWQPPAPPADPTAAWLAFKSAIPGATDREKIATLMKEAHAELVTVAIGGAAESNY